jgi:tetratricopeptide (TPR) repeat protein
MGALTAAVPFSAILGQSGPQADNAAALFQQGKAALQAGRYAAAEKDFKSVIALDPTSASPHINLGVTYMREKRWDDALVEFQKADSFAPRQSGIQLNIGLAHYRKNDYPAAIEPFTASLRLAPDSLQARYLLGLCYFFTNKYREASDTLAPLWEKESTQLNYLYVLGIAASKSHNPVLQKQAFDQMLAIGQNTPEFHLYLGKAWLAEDDTAKALEEFHAATAAKPDLALIHYFLGRTYLELRDYPNAKAELEKDIAIEPEFAYNYEDLGILYAQRDQPDKAEHYFREAVARNDQLVNSWFGLAKLYRDTGRYQEALAMLNRAEALAPQSGSVHYTRGQVLSHLGQTARAREEFDTSARLLKAFNDRLQVDPLGDQSADAQDAAQQ